MLDRVVLSAGARSRVTESLETALAEGEGRAEVDVIGRAVVPVSREFRCPRCDTPLARPQPVLFSFNHPLGACPECKGFGNILRYDETLVVPDPTRSLADGAVEPWSHPSGRRYQKQLLKAAKKRGVDISRPYAELPPEDRAWVYDGGDGFTGIQGFFEEVESYRYKLHVRVFLSRYRSQSPCPRCRGARLKPEALAVRVGGRHHRGGSEQTVEDLDALPRRARAVDLGGAGGAGRPEAPARQALVPPARRASATSRWRGRRGRSRAARPSASTWPTSWAPSSSARSTSSTSRRSGSTRATPRASPSSAGELAQAGNTVVIVEHDRSFIELRRLPDRDGARLGRARRQRGLRGPAERVPRGPALAHRRAT